MAELLSTALKPLHRFAHWLHLRWPAGTVEKLPLVHEDGRASLPGVRIVGDLSGIPLLKFAADTGARAVDGIIAEHGFRPVGPHSDILDVAIIGAGVAGLAAAIQAKQRGLAFAVFEASQPFFTIANFPKAKPIYTYPTDMKPAGELRLTASVKEALVDELEAQRRAHGIEPRPHRVERIERHSDSFLIHLPDQPPIRAQRVIVAIGRSGNFRKLGVPGEESDKVFNRLHDPKDYCQKSVLVVGGGDTAMETAIALAACGAHVTLSYRRKEFSRPKPENIEKLHALQSNPAAEIKVDPSDERRSTAAHSDMRGSNPPGSISLMLGSQLKAIRPTEVELLNDQGQTVALPNDVVFAMIGREPPLDFFRRSGLAIRGEWGWPAWLSLIAVLLLCVFLYHWKSDLGLPINAWFKTQHWFPYNIAAAQNPSSLWGTLQISLGQPSFYYSLAYCLCVVGFGLQRIRRRATPYITVQTTALAAIQCIPLFLLPYILLPWAGHNGWFDSGSLAAFADQFFPRSQWDPHGREYWRALGFILAWPLFLWNFFTESPLWGWLAVGALQTFVAIPALIFFFGKGAYCGWICSCGALAETLGDAHRHKMPHGPWTNRLNFVGQFLLLVVSLLMMARIALWIWPDAIGLKTAYMAAFHGKTPDWAPLPLPFSLLSYAWFVDLFLAGILGVGLYFHFSGRIWCRFACPLAALMHIYARFSRFRIFPDKSKCISCNVCTSVCHQGIDVMNFANKGWPMEDPQCVRCSACVQSCPTGVLAFGRYTSDGRILLDSLDASPVRMRERAARENS